MQYTLLSQDASSRQAGPHLTPRVRDSAADGAPLRSGGAGQVLDRAGDAGPCGGKNAGALRVARRHRPRPRSGARILPSLS
jgi:hypothetical protein